RVGPPPSSRQYQSAKTSTLVNQSSAPEHKSATGGSLCEGTAATSKPTDAISARVITLLMMMPSTRFKECLPMRCATTVGAIKTTMKTGSAHFGPTISGLGNATYIPPTASNASTACQRGSGLSILPTGS